MPVYEYRCRSCHREFSRTEKIVDHDAGAIECPHCHSSEVERVISPSYARTARKS